VIVFIVFILELLFEFHFDETHFPFELHFVFVDYDFLSIRRDVWHRVKMGLFRLCLVDFQVNDVWLLVIHFVQIIQAQATTGHRVHIVVGTIRMHCLEWLWRRVQFDSFVGK
jgi:hypothetical protein